MKNLISILIFSTLLGGCGDDETSSAGDSSTSSTGAFTTVVSAIDTAIQSTGEALGGSSLSPLSLTSSCTQGEPDGSSGGDATYPEQLVNCQLTSNSKSPDTVQGAYFLVKGIMCVIEAANPDIDYTEAGKVDGISIAENDSCWGTGGFNYNPCESLRDSECDNDTDDSITVSVAWRPTTGGDFDTYIGLQLDAESHDGDEDNDVAKIYFLQNSTTIGFRVPEYNEGNSTTGTYYEAIMTASSLIWENQDLENTRHTRIKVDGAINLSNGSITSINELYFIWSYGDDDDTENSSRRVVMSYAGYNEEEPPVFEQSYDHYTGPQGGNTTQVGGFSNISEISHNSAFYSFDGKVMPTTPETDAKLDLSTFDMSWD